MTAMIYDEFFHSGNIPAQRMCEESNMLRLFNVDVSGSLAELLAD
ncbi:hypothetical protein DSM3645_16965 [Blastopirellula marina DSM 3645]|uniref:Uncharacterized protein n=1 Tax=Blastopirellula marina DSM 3645 TaxID=314230 RepID=A3ZNG8_9BACT|nr:hypothetical protein DSM3645_16965 [Blastopirellula marina DSM 3645]